MVLDFITDVDADKSEFIAEPGTTIPLEFAEHLSNINFKCWFQNLQKLNTKLCKPMSRVTLGNIKYTLLFWLLGVINSLIEIGHLYFRMLKSSISVKYLYKFLKLKNPFLLSSGFVCSSSCVFSIGSCSSTCQIIFRVIKSQFSFK